MATIVKCPACGEINIGSRLACAKCQTSLIGVPREQGDSPLSESVSPSTPGESIATQSPPALASTTKPARPVNISPGIYTSTIAKEIRSWAITLIVLGVIHLFTSEFLSATWGVTLILVGLASFYFRSSAIMVVYAVTLAWAGIFNALSGETAGIVLAILQAFFSFRVFRRFFQYRNTERNEDESEIENVGLTPQRTEKSFPWISASLGLLSILGLIVVFMAAIIIGITTGSSTPDVVVFIEGLIVNLAMLGFGLGLSSILSKYPHKSLSITGMVTGLVTLVIEILFAVL